jgi:mRNA-degrading endonuclease RelE of RelBE toxin-antitoxin system
VGEYRVVYTVDDSVLIVAIERVRHRGEVYR